MAINTNRASIIYQATTALLSKTLAAIRTRNKKERKKLYAEAAKIRYALKALTFYSTYIDAEEANQILQCLIVTSGIQDYPVPPVTSAPSNPVSSVALVGPQGEQGERGNDGGATDFAASVNGNMVVDSFAITQAYAARWDYIINGTAQRAGTVYATWTEDGAAVEFSEISTPDANGSTSAVTFTVTHSASTIRLNAVVTSGTWEIRGSRYFIPNQGATVVTANTILPDGQVFIGNSSSVATARSVSGDIAITNTGVTSISAGVIVDADVNASADIALTKLASVANNTSVILSNGSGKLISIANGAAGTVLTSNGASAPTWQPVAGTGTVTSVNASGGTTGLSFSGGPVTTTGTLTLSGTLSYANGGTDQTFYTQGDLIYASAANTLAKRGIGAGGQILTVSSGVPNWSSNIAIVGTAQIQGGIDTSGSGVYYKTKVVDIGDWNMNYTSGGTDNKAVAHGLGANYKKIRAVSVVVRDDADSGYYLLCSYVNTSNANQSGGISVLDSTNVTIQLNTSAAADFANTNFDSTGYNRGYVTIFYES